jgi:hypothetical protein
MDIVRSHWRVGMSTTASRSGRHSGNVARTTVAVTVAVFAGVAAMAAQQRDNSLVDLA